MDVIDICINLIITTNKLIKPNSSVFNTPLFQLVVKLKISNQGTEVTGPKNIYKTGGSKTYLPKNFYTKTTYSPLLSEKFGEGGGGGGVGRPFPPLKCFAHGFNLFQCFYITTCSHEERIS
ncbi:hypothetical protein Hanom_Chr00s004772g01724981 [Helianthus anomalus]